MEDADEAVGECSEGLRVGISVGFALVVEGAAPGAGVKGAVRPPVEGVVEATVADVSGDDGPVLAGGDGDG